MTAALPKSSKRKNLFEKKNVRAGHITIKERLFLPPPHLLGLIKTELSQQIAMQSPQGQDF
jgi:hypothetical protein|tara:strand:- start:170 stop:352 length:183 start_codon:yes stop_codon:yes gene_type:complete